MELWKGLKHRLPTGEDRHYQPGDGESERRLCSRISCLWGMNWVAPRKPQICNTSMQETTEHLDLLDGLLEELLQAKWDAFARRKWGMSLVGFIIYYAVFFTAFMTRPFSMTTSVISQTGTFYDCLTNALWLDPGYNRRPYHIRGGREAS